LDFNSSTKVKNVSLQELQTLLVCILVLDVLDLRNEAPHSKMTFQGSVIAFSL